MAQAKSLNEKEIEQVLLYTLTRKNPQRDRALICISHLSGMRVKEIASLKIGDVVDAKGKIKKEIRLNASQTKGNRARIVFVNAKLEQELNDYIKTIRIDDCERAFFPSMKNTRAGFSANSLAQHFLHLYKGAGIEGASSHSGRRTYATTIASKGVGLRVLMRLMGHSSTAVTAVYIDANDNMLRNAVELV